jgi:pimeloyl-ACP methyl ester carboxylesterase
MPETVVPRPRSFYTEPDRVDVGGLDVAYRRRGEGEPVLYLHAAGFTRMWLPVHEALSASVDLIAPEHPGFGETEMPDWLDGFDDLAIHYSELLDALGLDRVHVVGHSLGGWIAAEFAVFYPERLRSLTLLTPVGLRVPGHPWPNLAAMSPDQRFARMFNDTTNMAQVLPDLDDLDEVVHLYGEATTLARLAWNPMYDLKLEHRLRRVTVPSMLLAAEDDRLVPREIGERYAQLLDAGVTSIPGTGHALTIEQPERVAEAVTNFVAEVAQ